MEKFVIIKDFIKKVRRFNLHGRTLEFKLNEIPNKAEPISWVKDAISGIIKKATEDLLPSDQVGFNFGCKDFARGEGWIRFRPAGEVTIDDVWNVISNVYQSNSLGLNTETFCLGVTTVRLPTGKGRGRKYNTFEEECGRRRGIVTINNKDNLCLPRALVVAKAYIDKDPLWAKIRFDTGKLQTLKAKQLMDDAAVEIPEEGAGIPELEKFQQHLNEYSIKVYNYGSKGRDVIFSGTGSKNLNLIWYKGHYNVITSLTSAFCCQFYCEECHVPHEHKNEHRCGGICPGCQQSPKCPEAVKIKCQDCLRSFRGRQCFDNHKPKICQDIRLCQSCLRTIQSNKTHTCGEVFCNICKKHQPGGHLCFIQPNRRKPGSDFLFIFYDFETRQETVLDDRIRLHEPNLCVFKQACNECLNSKVEICSKCGVRLQILKSSKCVEGFMCHILQFRKKFKEVIVLAHNGGGFDHQFILNHILAKTALKPKLIMRGTKLVLMQVGNVKFLDSLNYFPMKLSALPKAFGLGNFKKGYFPHLFNTEANQNYIGQLPDIKYYDPDTMKTDERDTFLEWYEVHKNDVFDFAKEIVMYCVSDVEILTAACLKFREQLLSTSNVCPFTEATTIASACNLVYRRNFLKPETIGIIPKGGYRCRDNQSKIALQWLVWEEKQRNVNIMYAAKGREVVLGGVKVDGYCAETNQVWEFNGDYFHGCPKCFKHGRDEPLHDDPTLTLNLRYESTLAKTDRLRSLGYEVIEMWECDFRKSMTQEMIDYTDNHPLLSCTPLDPRDAFYGGRTGNTMTYYKCKDDEKIKYTDVCSLYPWVCKYGKFPVGHPRVHVGNKCNDMDLEKMDGLIKCKILPPTNLFHPVLPTKMNDKLMFVLCRTCGTKMSQEECSHCDDERALHGTWVIDEVLKAVEKGYRIMTIYEIWQYRVEQYDRLSRSGGLFTNMMNKFIKIKQEASGWPSCDSEEAKRQYIEDFLEREDVKLEFADIVENPGLRALAKLMLNSFWGKFGQRENQQKTIILNEPLELFSMFSNPSIYVNGILPINETTVIVNWEFKEEAFTPLSTVNVCIAAYTTAQARLKLYSYLENLGDRTLYYDTDAAIFTYKEGDYDVPVGQFMGDMTDELSGYGPNSYITAFVSGGPKNYAYKVFSTNKNEEVVTCKVKGISLNYAASQLVNFESIKDMVLNESEPLLITANQFRRTKDHEVVIREETKIYRPNSTKRKFFEDHTSIPYGYRKQPKLN